KRAIAVPAVVSVENQRVGQQHSECPAQFARTGEAERAKRMTRGTSTQRAEFVRIERIDLDDFVPRVTGRIELVVLGLADDACGESEIVELVAGCAIEQARAHRV